MKKMNMGILLALAGLYLSVPVWAQVKPVDDAAAISCHIKINVTPEGAGGVAARNIERDASIGIARVHEGDTAKPFVLSPEDLGLPGIGASIELKDFGPLDAQSKGPRYSLAASIASEDDTGFFEHAQTDGDSLRLNLYVFHESDAVASIGLSVSCGE